MNNTDIREIIGGLGLDIEEWDDLSEKYNFYNIEENIQLNIYIGMLMKSIQNTMKNYFNIKLKEFDLTSSQFDIINFLIINEGKEITQKDIEKKLNLKNPTVTGTLQRLESKGFIERYTNEHDGRYKRIVLSDKAKSIQDSLYNECKSWADMCFSAISDEEKHIFINILMKFNKSIMSMNNNNNHTEKTTQYCV